MKKSFILLGVLALMLSGCDSPRAPSEPSEPIEPSEPSEPSEPIEPSSELLDYKISYLSSDKGAQYAANEFKVALEDLSINLNIEALDTYNNSTSRFYFKTDSESTGRFVISNDLENTVLSSDNAVGLVNAAHDVIHNIKTNQNEVNKWYETSVSKNYEQQEKVSMMTFNVRVADDGTRPNGDTANIANRAPRVLACIKTHMPDTLGIQEANDNWVSRLKTGLQPQYGFIGFGRDANLKGEGTGIFYNRDKVTLLEGGTKWLSDTPDVPGSKFSGCQYLRILTYGIFQRHSDGFIYMHINTHLDLNAELRLKDLGAIQAFSDPYKDKMPIFVTGDYNARKDVEDDVIQTMIDDYGYVDVMDEALDVTEYHTFSQDGYSDPGNQIVIDFLMKKNPGFYFTKYLVDNARYSGDGVEKPQVTSDHYPIYFEAIPYQPLNAYNEYRTCSDVEINNGFAHHDKQYNLVSHSSTYENVVTVEAARSTFNGTYISAGTTNTKFGAVGGMSSITNAEITYEFESEGETTADLALAISNNLVTKESYGIKNLANYVDLTLNDVAIDLTNIDLRCTDIRQLYEWENLILHDVSLKDGVNTLKMTAKNNVCPDHLLLEIFSNNEITPIETSDGGLETSNYINLGNNKITVAEFNNQYTTQKSRIYIDENNNLVLTMKVDDDATVDVSNIKGIIDFRNYAKVIFEGKGSYNFTIAAENDGIYVNNLVIEQNTNVTLTGYIATQKTGIKVFNSLTLNGTFTITKFLYLFAGWSEMKNSLDITINETGTLNLNNGDFGFYYSSGAQPNTFNIKGKLNIDVVKDCMRTVAPATYNFTNNSVTTLKSSTGVGIWNTASRGSAIAQTSNSGDIYLKDNAKVDIDVADDAIWGAKKLIVANGDDYETTNTASLIIKSKGTTRGYSGSNDTSGTKDANTVDMAAGGTLIFNTTGKILFSGAEAPALKTCIRFNGGEANIVIKCSDLSILDYDYAIGNWSTWSNPSVVYDYATPYAKMTVRANAIYNATSSATSNTSTFGVFTNETVNFSTLA